MLAASPTPTRAGRRFPPGEVPALWRLVHVWLRGPAAGWLVAIAATCLSTAVIGQVLGLARISNASLLYLIPVVAIAGRWGRAPAIGAAILAFLSFDWFFVEPLHTFTVAVPSEWLSLTVLLLAALYSAHLTGALRSQAQEARQRAWEATSLRSLATALARARDLPELLEVASVQARTTFHCPGCLIDLEGTAAQATDAATFVVPLRTPRGTLGSLRLDLSAEPEPGARAALALLEAFAAQLALAIERVRLQEEATQAEVLRRTDELHRAMLAAVSHDLRTPLAGIKAAATSLLQRDVAWSVADRDGFAQSINAGVDRLNRLITNLLDLVRIEAGALRLEKEPYLLADLIGEATRQAGSFAAPGQIVVENLVGAPSMAWVRVDPILMEQVLLNLLENAVKYGPVGAPVRVRGRVDGDRAVIEVEDQGPGIATDELDRVFERFYRVNRPDRSAGSGVGLAVSKALAEAHGGQVTVHSVVGRGSTFAIALPLDAQSPSPPTDEIQ